MFLHGGPGSGCNENHRRYFHPDKYRIIIFDQRGCHRSTPNGSVQNNSTQAILHDIESIRKKLNLERLILSGGSWGATLALLYAEQYPKQVAGLILRGIFLARQCDFDWFAGDDGVNKIFPDYWQAYLSYFDTGGIYDRLQILHSHIFSEDRDMQCKAAKIWSLWAGRVVTHSLDLEQEYALELMDAADENNLIDAVKIETHFAKHRYFMEENQILDNIFKIPKVPVFILHGRKDLTCLPEASWSVHQALPASQMVMVAGAGHLASEPSMVDALITASDQMADDV